MADTQITPWDQVNVDEEISAAEHAASKDISQTTPVGTFLCDIIGCDAIERSFKNYSCIAANLKMKINKVIRIEKPLKDDKGKEIKRDGVTVLKVVDVTPAEQVEADALNVGRFIFDAINLHNPLEKDAMKTRRIFVAKQIGLITQTATTLPTSVWPRTIGRKVIVTTERSSWVDKVSNERKENTKVSWDGYMPADQVTTGATEAGEQVTQPGHIEQDTSFDPDSFDI